MFRTCLCLSLILWYIRLLHFSAAYESLGPKLEMIYETISLKEIFLELFVKKCIIDARFNTFCMFYLVFL